jgi:hypothetical protein
MTVLLSTPSSVSSTAVAHPVRSLPALQWYRLAPLSLAMPSSSAL